MKKRFWMLNAVMFSLAFTSSAMAATVLKLGHIAETSAPYGQGAEFFAKLVKEKSKGDLEIQVFPSSSLGTAKELIEGLIYGTVDMMIAGTAELGTFQPEVGLFDMPFLFNDRVSAYKAWDTVGMELSKPLEAKGIHLLGWMEQGIRHMTNNVRPIKAPTDIKGLKIRVQNNKTYVEMIKALGGSPTPMAFAELYSALQSGVVDGQETPSSHIYTKRFYEVQKYASLTGHTFAAEPVLISIAAWKKLSPDQKKIIQDAADESVAWERKLAEAEDNNFWDKIKETGKMEVIEVDIKPFQKATEVCYKDLPAAQKEFVARIRAAQQ
ncbi:MAG: DctP family TRAP transporter solute-binding subunit [Candidatus Accumulibacter sp.]|jgi:tripartite ATP-independent transporter DctP family solute receptor|nr:DctP family TRAP transporter solute-binding subunit [Accumulibacter sp.]